LDARAWKEAGRHLRKRAEAFTAQAMDHHDLLTELRGEAQQPAQALPFAKVPTFGAGQGQPTVMMPGMAPPRVKIQPAKPKLDPVEAEGGAML
jgi:hypothetical protein